MKKDNKIPSFSCCYLIRLDKPLGSQKHSAQYYLGSCANLKKRFEQHLKGTGAAFTRAAIQKGIPFEIVYVWRTKTKREARQLEVKLKRQKNNRVVLTRQLRKDNASNTQKKANISQIKNQKKGRKFV